MRLSRRAALSLGALFSVPRVALGAPPKAITAISGATLLSASKPPRQGTLIRLKADRISDVSAGSASGEGVLDASGKVLTAGFVDLLTQTGLVEIELERSTRNEAHRIDDAIRAGFRAADGYDPASSVLAVSRLGGITSVGVVPQGGLVSGQSAWADLGGERATDDLIVPRASLHVEPELAEEDGKPMSVGTALLRLRELFDDARRYARNPGAFDGNRLRKLNISRLDLAAAADALAGRLTVTAHVDRAADISSFLALAREYKLRLIIASAAEGWKVASELAAARVPVITHALNNLPDTFASRYARADGAALMARAGVRVALSTGETHNARKLRQEAGNAIRAGLPREAALAAVTEVPAEIAGLGARYGKVEAGHVANLVVWSGDPFELSTKVEAVIVHGRALPLVSRQTELLRRYR